VVTSYDLADGSGPDVVEQIRAIAPQTPCVLFTDVAPSEVDTSSFEETIVEYLNRDLPDAHDRLWIVVDDLIAHSTRVSFRRPDDEDARLDALAQYDVDTLPTDGIESGSSILLTGEDTETLEARGDTRGRERRRPLDGQVGPVGQARTRRRRTRCR